MIKTTLKLNNHLQVRAYMNRKAGDGTSLVRAVNNAMRGYVGGVLEITTPIFSGDLLKSRRYREVVYKNVGRLYITHDARDRNSGKPYLWYAEHGRRAAVAKRSPQKWMRYWDIPHQSSGNPFKIFAKKVGPAEPTYFIRNAVQSARGESGTLSRLVIQIWLMK